MGLSTADASGNCNAVVGVENDPTTLQLILTPLLMSLMLGITTGNSHFIEYS